MVKRPCGRVIGGDRRARLHLCGGDALVAERPGDDESGRGEGRLRRRGVAELRLDREIAGNRFVDQRRARHQRRDGVGDGGERLVIDDDAFGGVLRRRRRLRDRHGDGFADIAHAVRRQRRMRRIERRLAPRPAEGPQLDVMGIGRVRHVRDAAAARGGIIGGGEDREHAGKPGRGGAIDGAEPRMGVGRSHEARIDLPGEGGIVAETAAPGDQTKVFESRHRPADIRLAPPMAGFRHACSAFRSAYRVSRWF